MEREELIPAIIEGLITSGKKMFLDVNIGCTYEEIAEIIADEILSLSLSPAAEPLTAEKPMTDAMDIEGREFYELMQQYRFAPMSDQDRTVKAFEAVKDWIKQYASLKPTVEVSGVQDEFNIQSEVVKIHHQYGTTELANYRIQQLFEKYAGIVRKSRTVEVSDGEIDQQFPVRSNHQMDIDSWNNRERRHGARWMRELIKERSK